MTTTRRASNNVSKKWIAGLVLGLFILIPSAQAGTSPIDEQNYPTAAGRKLGRGVANLAFGWIDIFKGISDVAAENNTIAAMTWGPIYGLGKAVVRTAAGAYEIVTFPIPVPPDFEPLVQPEFVLDNKK